LKGALAAVSHATARGMEKTKDIATAMGQAKSLSNRAIGPPEPGAVCTHMSSICMAAFVKENGTS
jgi:hypothetical protein